MLHLHIKGIGFSSFLKRFCVISQCQFVLAWVSRSYFGIREIRSWVLKYERRCCQVTCGDAKCGHTIYLMHELN